MAGGGSSNPEQVAKSWFVVTMIGVAVYIGAVFTFIL